MAWRHQQIAERLSVASAHASTELMKLAESEILGIVHQDGCSRWHVYAVLHDSGGEQHVVVMVGEVYDGLLKTLRSHLAMRSHCPCAGYKPSYLVFKLREVLDAVGDKEHLSVAAQFEIDGLLPLLRRRMC